MTRNNISPTDQTRWPAERRQRLRKMVGLTAFLCVVAVLLATFAYCASIRRSIGREIASLESPRDRLQVIADRLETEDDQAERDKRVVSDLLRHCRAADDIPNLGGSRIVARRQGFETLCIYVPEGSHTLEISSTWKPASTPESDMEVDAPANAGEKSWKVELLPACGYLLELSSDRGGRPIRWELSGNRAEFKTQTGMVPLEGFKHQGSSWSGSDVVQFPNQIERFSIDELKTAAQASPGVTLMTTTLRGPRDDQPYQVKFNVRLYSHGPVCVSASDALRIIVLGQEDLLLPYQGGGKYELRTSDAGLRP